MRRRAIVVLRLHLLLASGTAGAARNSPAAKAALAVTDGFRGPALPRACRVGDRQRPRLERVLQRPRARTRGRVARGLQRAGRSLGRNRIRQERAHFACSCAPSASIIGPRCATRPRRALDGAAGDANDPKGLRSQACWCTTTSRRRACRRWSGCCTIPPIAHNPNRCTVGNGIASNLAVHRTRRADGVDGRATACAPRLPRTRAGTTTSSPTPAKRRACSPPIWSARSRAMNDQKLLAPDGSIGAVAKPQLAEAWRSGRSKRDLVLNMAVAARDGAAVCCATRGRPIAPSSTPPLPPREAAVKALPADIRRGRGQRRQTVRSSLRRAPR